MDNNFIQEIKTFVLRGVKEKEIKLKSDNSWRHLIETGSEVWLDTGDIEVAESLWTSELKALTTNNALLNNEIQKGIYDDFIQNTKEIVSDLPLKQQVIEIAFMLNARHGLRLVQKFGVNVSVELHTDTAHDVDAIIFYGKRFHEICPEKFIVKVPYTAAGLIGARKLREAGIKINFTLEFSARQNVLATLITKPNYLNIFMGRIGGYFKENNIGTGINIGEKTVLSTQKWVNKLSKRNPESTQLIIASLTTLNQIKAVAGIDIFTIPPTLISEGNRQGINNINSHLNTDYQVDTKVADSACFPDKFWQVTDSELDLAKYLDQNCPEKAEDLIKITHEAGCSDMFPILSETELDIISADGKIPNHKTWASKIEREEIAIDTLLNIAGLYVFKHAQNQLDARIKGIITKQELVY